MKMAIIFTTYILNDPCNVGGLVKVKAHILQDMVLFKSLIYLVSVKSEKFLEHVKTKNSKHKSTFKFGACIFTLHCSQV